MTDPTQPTVHLDPGTLRLLYVALASLVALIGGAATLAWRAIGWGTARVRQSDREASAIDHVHGVGRTQETPGPDEPGLVDQVAALKRHARLVALHLELPDAADEDALLQALADRLPTHRLQRLTEERLTRSSDDPPPRRPDGRYRGSLK